MPIATKPFEALNETTETFENSELLIVNSGNNPQRLPFGKFLNSVYNLVGSGILKSDTNSIFTDKIKLIDIDDEVFENIISDIDFSNLGIETNLDSSYKLLLEKNDSNLTKVISSLGDVFDYILDTLNLGDLAFKDESELPFGDYLQKANNLSDLDNTKNALENIAVIGELSENVSLEDDDKFILEKNDSNLTKVFDNALSVFTYIASKLFGTEKPTALEETDLFTIKSGTNYYNIPASDVGGGMDNPMSTAGDIIYGGVDGTPTRLGKGTSGHFLKQGATNPAWVDVVTSDITAVANTVPARSSTSNGALSNIALAASRLLGRGSTGNVAAISLGTGLSMSGTTLNSSNVVYTGSSDSNTDFPIGTHIQYRANLKSYAHNESVPVRLGTFGQYNDSSGSFLTGTWRHRGQAGSNVGNGAQRTV